MARHKSGTRVFHEEDPAIGAPGKRVTMGTVVRQLGDRVYVNWPENARGRAPWYSGQHIPSKVKAPRRV